MSDVVIYLTRVCPYCVRARALLDKKGVPYTVIDVNQDRRFWDEMLERSGRSTVPQIFIGERHVGGFDDMVTLDVDGELDRLLGLE
jgi:glutaredoxin 3